MARTAWRGIQYAVCVTGVLHCDARVLHLSALLSTLFGQVSISLFVKVQVGEVANVPSFFVAQFELLRVMDDHERRVRLGSCL